MNEQTVCQAVFSLFSEFLATFAPTSHGFAASASAVRAYAAVQDPANVYSGHVAVIDFSGDCVGAKGGAVCNFLDAYGRSIGFVRAISSGLVKNE